MWEFHCAVMFHFSIIKAFSPPPSRSDPYIFSLATNPFYLWLICTIFSEAGEDFIPKTLTQLYTWVMLVFANRSAALTQTCRKFSASQAWM